MAKIETCRGVPTLDFAARCDGALNTDGALARMHKFLAKAPFPSWFRPFVDYEAGADPPLLWVVLDEGVLHRKVGNSKEMRGQLMRLAEVSRRPNITIEVVPYGAGAHSGLLGAFVVAEFEDAPAIVYLETAAGGQIAEASSTVAEVMRRQLRRGRPQPPGRDRGPGQ